MDPPVQDQTKKKRRRIHLNCEECRRTKSKCNRSWPCSECVKKGLAHICPNQVSKITQPKSVTIAELTARVKYLEESLRRNGLAHELTASEAPSVTAPSASLSPPNMPSSLPGSSRSAVEMAAMLGHMALGHIPTKRHAGMGTTAFYLSSPEQSEDEGSEDERRGSNLWKPPWGRSTGVSLTGKGHLPGVLLDRCRIMLPSRRAAKDMFNTFFEVTSWRIQPMTPAFFDTVLASVYDSSEGAHPHDLAVLFATMAMTMLFDEAASGAAQGFQAKDYHETAYSCLQAGNFYTETSLSSLICLHLLGSFLINSDDKRLPDGIFPITGLGVRLAIIAGYHRDKETAHAGTRPEEADWRRRIWHELLALERVHCLTALLPGSIAHDHYDTPYPSDAHKEGYFVWKWNLGVHMQRVHDFWTRVETPDLNMVQDIDAGLRRLLHSLPAHLRCSSFPIEAFPLVRPGAPAVVVSPPPASAASPGMSDYTATLSAERLLHQQYRMATHICMVFFYLHRPIFMRAMATGDPSCELSVRTIIEVCERMLQLVRGILSQDGSMARWFSFAADLFSVLLCQAVLVVKTTEAHLVPQRLGVLEEGLAILEWTVKLRPNSKNRALTQRMRRVVAKAREALAASGLGASPNHVEVERVEFQPGLGVLPLHSLGFPPTAFALPHQSFQPELFNSSSPSRLGTAGSSAAPAGSIGTNGAGGHGPHGSHAGHGHGAHGAHAHGAQLNGVGAREAKQDPSPSSSAQDIAEDAGQTANDENFEAWLAMLFPPGTGEMPVVDPALLDAWAAQQS